MFVDLYITHKTHSFSPPAGEMVTERISERIWMNHFGERTENERISWKNQSFHHYRVRTLALRVLSRCVSLRSWVHSAVRSPVHVCLVVCTQFVFLSAACIHVMSCAVWQAVCVFHWLHAIMWSCFVWTHTNMSILISCVFVSCFTHGWWFLFRWPCACVFVLCEHMAFVLVFCVPWLSCDYWLICPTCFFLVTLLICPALALPASCPVFPLRGSFCFVPISCTIESSPHPFTPTLTLTSSAEVKTSMEEQVRLAQFLLTLTLVHTAALIYVLNFQLLSLPVNPIDWWSMKIHLEPKGSLLSLSFSLLYFIL